MNAF
jgi:hypothetical protein